MGAMFLSDVVTVTGKLSSFKYLSDIGSEVTKTFCANCGSPIYGKNTRTPSHLTLSLGTKSKSLYLNETNRIGIV